MSNCRACLIFCMDFRFRRHLSAFLADQNLDRDGVDIIRVAGAAKNLARPKEPRDREFLIEQLDISRMLHGVSQFYLVNHEDCGAYGEEDVQDTSEELSLHTQDLLSASDLLGAPFPEVEVIPCFMRLDGKYDLINEVSPLL